MILPQLGIPNFVDSLRESLLTLSSGLGLGWGLGVGVLGLVCKTKKEKYFFKIKKDKNKKENAHMFFSQLTCFLQYYTFKTFLCLTICQKFLFLMARHCIIFLPYSSTNHLIGMWMISASGCYEQHCCEK